MPLEAGILLGPYRIEALLGAGGMGEVYRAQDPRLGRAVALKVLAPHLAEDRSALARFEREARTASALNHPHLVHIYEIGESPTPAGTVRYIAMEYVEGETLRTRLKGGARWEALLEPLALVADAVDKAHRAGIIHRDLKPENVLITPDGYPKVVDFGLAKLTESAPSPTSTGDEATATFDGHTRSGMIVGTPGYMSPEQVVGKTLDHRSDIFSFGCVLYEAATGQRPFGRPTSAATLHAIVFDEPAPIESLSPKAPPELTRIVGRCLAKEPALRYSSMKDAADDLRLLGAASASRSATARVGWVRAAWAAGIVLAAVGLTLAVLAAVRWRVIPPSRSTDAPREDIRVEKLTNRGNVGGAVISPDGRYLVYTTEDRGIQTVWLRDLVEKADARLGGPYERSRQWFRLRFSPDGKSLLYTVAPQRGTTNQQYQIPLIGGEPRLLRVDTSDVKAVESPDQKRVAFVRPRGGLWELSLANQDGGDERPVGDIAQGGALAWSQDSNQLLYYRGAKEPFSVLVVSKDGRQERTVGTVSREPFSAWWSPDGRHVLCALLDADDNLQLFDLDVATGQAAPLGEKVWYLISSLRWLPDGAGFVVEEWPGAARGGSRLWLVSYPDGTPKLVPNDGRTYEDLSGTADGTRLAARQSASRSDLLVTGDPENEPFRKLTGGTDMEYSFCWTPDGKLVYSSNDGGSYDLYVAEPDGSGRRQLTFDREADERLPAASPDGRYVVFQSNRSGVRVIERVNADGTGRRPLTSATAGSLDTFPRFTADGSSVVYVHWDGGGIAVWKVPTEGGAPVFVRGGRTPRPGAPREWASGVAPSPDGTKLALHYMTRNAPAGPPETRDIAITSLDGTILKRLPLGDGEGLPYEWAADGRSLYLGCRQGGVNNLCRRSVDGGPATFVTRFEEDLQYYAWSHDGRRLACARGSDVRDAVLITGIR